MTNFEKINSYQDIDNLINFMSDESLADYRKFIYQEHKKNNKTDSLLHSKKDLMIKSVENFIFIELNKCIEISKKNPYDEENYNYIFNYVEKINDLFNAFKFSDFKSDLLQIMIPDCKKEIIKIIYENPERGSIFIRSFLNKISNACQTHFNFNDKSRKFVDRFIDSPYIQETLNLKKEIEIDTEDPVSILLKLKLNDFPNKENDYIKFALILRDLKKHVEIEEKERISFFLTTIMTSDILNIIPNENSFHSKILKIKSEILNTDFLKKDETYRLNFYNKINELSIEFSFGLKTSTDKHDSLIEKFYDSLKVNSIGSAIGAVDSSMIYFTNEEIYIVNQHSTLNKNTKNCNNQQFRAYRAIKNDISLEKSQIKQLISEKFGVDTKNFKIKQASIQILAEGIKNLPNFFSSPHPHTLSILNTLEYFKNTLSYSKGLLQEININGEDMSKDFITESFESIRDIRRLSNYNPYVEEIINSNSEKNSINILNTFLNVIHNSLEIFEEKYVKKEYLDLNNIRSGDSDFSNLFGKPLFELISDLSYSIVTNYNPAYIHNIVIKNHDKLFQIAKQSDSQSLSILNNIFSEIADNYNKVFEYDKQSLNKIKGGIYPEDFFDKIKFIEPFFDYKPKFDINNIKSIKTLKISDLTHEQAEKIGQEIINYAINNGFNDELIFFGTKVLEQYLDGVIPRKGKKPEKTMETLMAFWKYSVMKMIDNKTPIPPSLNILPNNPNTNSGADTMAYIVRYFNKIETDGNIGNQNTVLLEKVVNLLQINLNLNSFHNYKSKLRKINENFKPK